MTNQKWFNKNRESWNQYQNEYRKNNYKQVSAMLDPALVDDLKDKLAKENRTFTDFLRESIKNYLDI